MMKKHCEKNMVTMGTILLFLGVAIAPSVNFNVVKASMDDRLVDVTTQACGVKGFENTTVRLTLEQYQNLQHYLRDFTERLNQTTTREEAVPLFNEAVVELNKYKLLPRGMNVVQAQRLVTRTHQSATILQSFLARSRGSMANNSTNAFCLVAGYSNNTELITLYQWMVFGGLTLICGALYSLPVVLYLMIMVVLVQIAVVLVGLGYLFPLALWGDIKIFGGHGFLFTLGLEGVKKWIGELHGKINGFTGLKILLDLKEPIKFFYLGAAREVQME